MFTITTDCCHCWLAVTTADRESFAIRYCLPVESIAAEPQKLLFVNLRYAVSLKYERDPSFDADHRDDDGADGEKLGPERRVDKETEQLSVEAAAALAEETRVKDRERRRLYVRLLVGAGLLVLSAAVVMLGMSLYSMEFSSRDLRETLLPVVLGLVPFAMAFAGTTTSQHPTHHHHHHHHHLAMTPLTKNDANPFNSLGLITMAWVCTFVSFAVGFLVLRLGTFRILSVDPDSATAYVIYNHRETDERIFEALVDSVSAKVGISYHITSL